MLTLPAHLPANMRPEACHSCGVNYTWDQPDMPHMHIISWLLNLKSAVGIKQLFQLQTESRVEYQQQVPSVDLKSIQTAPSPPSGAAAMLITEQATS